MPRSVVGGIDSIYHAVFACMRGTPGYPAGRAYQHFHKDWHYARHPESRNFDSQVHTVLNQISKSHW